MSASKRVNTNKLQGDINLPSISATTIDFYSGSTNYIDFISGNTNPTAKTGRLFFSGEDNALSYHPYTNNMDVTINLGQEEVIIVYNNTGNPILNGQALSIDGTYSGSPSVTLAISSDLTGDTSIVSGIATHQIDDGELGIITNFGIVRNLNLSGFSNGDVVYLSDTVLGGYELLTGLQNQSRRVKLGRVISNDSIDGRLLVLIENESPLISSLSNRQTTIFNINNTSTGVISFSGISVSGTSFSVGSAKGWVIDNTTDPCYPTVTPVYYSGATGLTSIYLSGYNGTYLMIDNTSSLVMQPTLPTAEQRRENLFLGKVTHPNKTTYTAFQHQLIANQSPYQNVFDMFTSFNFIKDGFICSPNGVNLNFNISEGDLFGLGINFPDNSSIPNQKHYNSQTPATFRYRTQTGGTTSDVTLIDPTKYDVAGVITTIPGSSKRATNQRIYLFPGGEIRIGYGQQYYSSLTEAIAASQNETFIEYSNFSENAILIGVLSVAAECTDLSDTSDAKFIRTSIFGENIGGAAGITTATLQTAYNNSTNPEIITNSTLGAVQFRGGTGTDTDKNIIIENNAGTETGWIRADGTAWFTSISGSSITASTVLDQVYLTYSGTSGTTSGTKGCTLTSPGNWTITQFSTAYFIDDTDGNITVTIPDSDATNLGKTLHVSKPRLVQSGNYVLVKTVSNQAVAETSTFYLRSPNDRAELISVPFVANGAPGYKYRVNMINRSIHEAIEISVGGTQLFSDIKSAVDYVNAYADGPRRLKVNPGTYYIGETIEINCPYNIVLQGFSPELTHFIAQPSLSGTPMFDIVTQCDFDRITFSGCPGYGLVDDECCLDCGSDDLYIELHNVVIDGFYKGFEIEGNSKAWVFDSIIENCVSGVWISGGTIGISETTLDNNNVGAFFANTSTAATYSIQNTILNVNTGQTGILYVDNGYKPTYNFATGNAFYGDGTYISGLTFSSMTQADIRYENNVGLEDYKPECWVWVSGNTNTTTLTTAGTYYKANVNVAAIKAVDMIKFSGGAVTQYFTYLPTITRKGNFVISGDLSASNNNDVISVALYKNETIKLQDIDVRTTTATQPYPFAFNGINNISPMDKFDIRMSCINTNTRTAILRTLMFAVTT